jgi:spore coat protein U-like protein
MTMEMKRKLLGAVALFAMFSAFEANAQTVDLNVTAEVQAGCMIDSPAVINMPFGALDPLAAGPHVQTADFTFHCTAGTPVSIELDAGTGSPAAYLTNRVMTGAGTNTLLYRLETTANADWGLAADTADYTMNASGWSTPDTVTIQGVITQANVQAAAVDATYQDTVVVTLNF